ncbi:MAG: SulP family inorganic anion transporter [Polyangiales bacterium]
MTARAGLAGNLAAGLTVTLVALPLNIALAIAAGLPPSAGLVAGAVSGVVGALLGGSRFQITGPEVALAPITLEIASRHGLSGLAVATFLAGLFQLLFGTLRLGSLVHAIPLPVVGGFLAAVGLLVFNTQIPRLLGLPGEVASIAHFDFTRDLARISLPAVCVGLGVIAILVVLPRVHRRLPAALFALLVGVGAVAVLKLPLPTVTPLEVSLPIPSLPRFGEVDWLALMPEALALALLASIDSLLCAVSVDSLVGGDRTRTDQELAAQGLANLTSSLFGGMPVAAAVVRSVAAYEAGATTRLAALTQSVLLFGLLFLAPLLGNVPLVALAAILLVVGYRLIQWRVLVSMLRMARTEGFIFIGTALGILMTDFVLGVALGVIAALARFAQQQRASLQTRATRDLSPEAESTREPASSLRLLRVEGPLFFASQRSIEDAVSALHQAAHVVVDVSAVSTVDLSGATALANALSKLSRGGVRVRVTTFGAEMDPLLTWAFENHAPGHVLPLEQRAEQALRSLAQRATLTAALKPDQRISA